MTILYADAGTTWSKVCEIGNNSSDFYKLYKNFLTDQIGDKKFYIIPSNMLKTSNFVYKATTGHMSNKENNSNYLNEVIALSKGFLANGRNEGLVLDLGSRDVKWVQFKNGKFKDLDWNNSCASATGATVEMLLKFYNVKPEELEFNEEKYNITCGIFGLEKIMDDIANGEKAKFAISKFLHGIAYNAWTFAKKPEKLYLSGGFCQNKCFLDSLSKYVEVVNLGRFILVDGLMSEFSNSEIALK